MDVVRLYEPFAVDREQVNHREALMTFGEKVTVRRVWTIHDFRDNLVDRCPDCHAGSDAGVQARVAAVYKQSGESYCPTCYGIGFEGGFRPTLYITYALITDQLEDWQRKTTGEMTPAKPSAQFFWEPKLQEFDICARFTSWSGDDPVLEEDRFVLREVQPVTLRTGNRPRPPADPLTGGSVGVTEAIIVAQQAQIENLPREHPLLEVQMTP